MKNAIKILAVQNNAVIKNRSANFEKISSLLISYKDKNIDLIVLPELWSIGWDCSVFREVAESQETSEVVSFLSNLAKKYNSNVVGGSYIRKTSAGEYKNTCPVFNRSGELICQYDKMHLFSYLGDTENLYVTRGGNPVIAETDIGNIGLSICYDLRFPELFRKYALNGADILINVAAWPKSRKNHWVTLQKARAIENQMFMIAVSQTGIIKNDKYNLGCSMVINPYGDIVESIDEEESVLEYNINLKEMVELRENVLTLSDIHSQYEFKEE